MFHRGIDDANMSGELGKSWSSLKSEIRSPDPVQQRAWQCYFETQINAQEFLSVAMAICSTGGMVLFVVFWL